MTNFNIFELDPVVINHHSRGNGGESDLQLTMAGTNGNRATVPEETTEKVGATDTIEVGFNRKGILMGARVPGGSVSRFPLKVSGKRKVIYSKELVRLIVDKFGISMEGITSRSFYDCTTFHDTELGTVAFIEIDPSRSSVDGE